MRIACDSLASFLRQKTLRWFHFRRSVAPVPEITDLQTKTRILQHASYICLALGFETYAFNQKPMIRYGTWVP